MGVYKTILILGIVTSIALYFLGCFNSAKVEAPKPNPDAWWTVNKPTKIDTSIRPFQIAVTDATLKDLKARLTSATRVTKPLSGINFEYGTNGDFVEKIRSHWLNNYQWREREKLLNQYPQFLTNIEGLDIHFFHIKPTNPGNKKVLPLILLHGWPGSIVEFYKIIPMLRNSEKKDFTFELIIPSLPGYGFSQGSELPGLGYVEIAQIMHKLMSRLGHEKYYVQGGDWGSIIGTFMSVLYPNNVKATHLNACYSTGPASQMKMIAASFAPNFFFGEEDAKYIYPLSDLFKMLLREFGYFHLHATKPDTVGVALNDSPLGLAAYIFEKYAIWTDKDALSKVDGGLPVAEGEVWNFFGKRNWIFSPDNVVALPYNSSEFNSSYTFGIYTMDELLDNIMLYWVTGSITTSIRLYSESFSANYFSKQFDSVAIEGIIGCSMFPNEVIVQPESLLKDRYLNLIHYKRMPKGGHFAAFEQPAALSEEILEFVTKVENLPSKI